jgi:hypothetical protein
MQDAPKNEDAVKTTLPDEDGAVMIYGFLVIKDADTGEILVSTRS